VIRDAVIHLHNEQPLLADLPGLPSPGDVAVVCTNLRTRSGKRPVFVDHSESTFVFPYAHVRFLEIPVEAGRRLEPLALPAPSEEPGEPGEPEEIELDEDLLRRVREL
jgi:hypothetical protein